MVLATQRVKGGYLGCRNINGGYCIIFLQCDISLAAIGAYCYVFRLHILRNRSTGAKYAYSFCL